jgi:hypothetical protein
MAIYPQIIAAQRSRSMAPQIAINTTTIFQCLLANRFVDIGSPRRHFL